MVEKKVLTTTVHKMKDVRGRIVGYRARLSSLEGQGDTPALAAEACGMSAYQALERLTRGTKIGKWRDHVYVVAPTECGWSYWIDTFTTPDYVVQLRGEREDAEDSALHHLAQNLWTHEVDDEAFVERLPSKVAAEIRRWASWQRGYKRAADEGKTDHEARLAADCAQSALAPHVG